MIEAGSGATPGAWPIDGGVNFAVHSGTAEQIELCLFTDGVETARIPLPEKSGDVWHGWLPHCGYGQAYGYRAHGRYAPQEGLRTNPNKLLLDPYARRLEGPFAWHPAVFDFADRNAPELMPSKLDSAAFVPKAVVCPPDAVPSAIRPQIPWRDMVIYEANVRGYTMRHPALTDAERGSFRGMRNGRILDHLKSLGITSLELMPVFEFIDEHHLAEKGLRNLWGYNTVNFFTPAARYLCGDDAAAFREMVDSIHDAGIEVILDVAYNHSGEGGRFGPSLCFRGLDNRGYYRLDAKDPGRYVNDTGCGNTLDADQAVVQSLVRDSLSYWHEVMGVDGFRFDLATVLGRGSTGYRVDHPLLTSIAADRRLANVKLIAEPWHPGPEGYQLGNFPQQWAEWNDRFRDDSRRFWRGEVATAAELARRLHGSADIFEESGRGPSASINFVTCHDGFTLADLVSYENRHNEANGEANRDGHQHNFSSNGGVEGPTDDPAIRQARRRRRLNLLATLLYSQGTPMLLAGDELGNSQQGNNNAYAQDNPTGWTDWQGIVEDPAFVDAVRTLVQLRQSEWFPRPGEYLHEHPEVAWHAPDGALLEGNAWDDVRAFTVLMSTQRFDRDVQATALLLNGGDEPAVFELPDHFSGSTWEALFTSGETPLSPRPDGNWQLAGQTVAWLQRR